MKFWSICQKVISKPASQAKAHIGVLGCLLVLALAGSTFAVSPAVWRQSTESDFAKGTFDAVVPSSLGEIRLARKVHILLSSDSAPAIVSAVAAVADSLFVASGTEPIIYKVLGEKIEQFAELPGTMITALRTDGKGGLLAGVGGDEAGIYAISPAGEVTKVWTDEQIAYVWAIEPGPGGVLYAATGPQGKVYAIGPDANAEEIYAAGDLAKNILALAWSPEGLLYAGTDKSGLVVEIDPHAKTSRIVLDAAEKEISAILIDEAGGLFVSTADAAKASADGKSKPNNVPGGRADKPAATQPTSQPTSKPAQPDKPESPTTTQPSDDADPAEVQEALDELKSVISVIKGSAQDAPTTQPAAAGPASAIAPAPAATTQPAVTEEPEPQEDEGKGEDKDEAASPTTAPAEESAATPPAETGESDPQPQAKAPATPPASATPRSTRRPKPRSAAASPKGPGNAVYYIRPDGLVETRFRRPITILAMVRHAQTLYLGTGNGGAIYSLSTDGDEIAKLADTDAKQVTALAMGVGGEIFFGTANLGSAGKLAGQFAKKGTYLSQVQDAKQLARWGTMQLQARADTGATVTVATRSGNVAKADEDTWSSWSAEQPAGGYLRVASPAARFAQYRLTLRGDGEVSPTVRQVQMIYQVGNLPPVVSAVTVKASAKSVGKRPPKGNGAMPFRQIAIKAADVNGDKLVYKIEFREMPSRIWVQITEKLKTPKFGWDTRTVADGVYELRVTASDSISNPPADALSAARISEIVTVDNTPPVIEDFGAQPLAGKILLRGRAFDAASRIVSLHYSVDSQEKWTAMACEDGIADSDRESFRFDLADLEAGEHRITVKIEDLYGNIGYASLAVTIPRK